MKKFLLFFSLLPFVVFSQQFPSYPVLLNNFFSNYSYSQVEAVDGLNFARTKDGWHVQVIDRVTEKVKSDQLYWSLQIGDYLALDEFEKPSLSQKEKQVSNFLTGSALYSFYGYERCRYYGYSHWAEDMINDFGKGPKNNYSDTLMEGLGRAYSAYSSKFLWYQYGGEVEKDSLKKKLHSLQLPSKARIDSTCYYIQKAIETFKLLAQKNNAYTMLVGNSGMKLFNEQMNGYMQMSMAGNDSLARMFLNNISPNSTLTNIAKNYLNACAPNAVVFTNGDNDTYPLWYIQEKENYRKDVAVLNTNLLGLAYYIQMLERKNIVSFSTKPEIYGDASFLYFIKKENTGPLHTTLDTFLKDIQNKKYTAPSEAYGTLAGYTQTETSLAVDLNLFKKIWSQPNLKSQVKISFGDYILNDQFMLLDIINSNLYTRPVYFTFGSELLSSYFIRTGPIVQFLPLDETNQKLTEKISFQKTRDYILNQYKVLPSADFSSGISTTYNFDQEACYLYSFIADHHLNNNRRDSAAVIMGKLLNKYNNRLPITLDQTGTAITLINAGYAVIGQNLMEDCADLMFRLYQNPSALYPYISKEKLVSELSNMQYTLKQANIPSEKIDETLRSLHE